jgi:hypothetical protein
MVDSLLLRAGPACVAKRCRSIANLGSIVSEDAVLPLEEIARRILSQEENSNANMADRDTRIKESGPPF